MSNLKKNKKKKQLRSYMAKGLIVLTIILLILIGYRIISTRDDYTERKGEEIDASKPDIEVALLTQNPNSRPGLSTLKIKNIVVHYTANPGSTAMDNRNYFESLKDETKTQASSNFIVGMEGEIVQCVPTWEIAYASNDRNIDSVSIEFCHPDVSGKPTEETYQSLTQLCAWLCKKFELTQDDIIRHYDITGKICPKYFVDEEEAFKTFKADVGAAIERGE